MQSEPVTQTLKFEHCEKIWSSWTDSILPRRQTTSDMKSIYISNRNSLSGCVFLRFLHSQVKVKSVRTRVCQNRSSAASIGQKLTPNKGSIEAPGHNQIGLILLPSNCSNHMVTVATAILYCQYPRYVQSMSNLCQCPRYVLGHSMTRRTTKPMSSRQ